MRTSQATVQCLYRWRAVGANERSGRPEQGPELIHRYRADATLGRLLSTGSIGKNYDLHVPFFAFDVETHVAGVAPQREIHNAIADTQVLDPYPA